MVTVPVYEAPGPVERPAPLAMLRARCGRDNVGRPYNSAALSGTVTVAEAEVVLPEPSVTA